MANTKFTRAVKKAKALYKSGRYKKFSDAVKAAYKKVGKVGASKKRSPLKGRKHRHYGKVKSHKRRVNAVNIPAKKHTDYNSPEVNISIGSLKSAIKRKLETRLANQLLRRETAKNYKTYNLARKAVQDTKQQLRKFQ